MAPNPWIGCRRPDPAAELRLFCFPYAGVGASAFRGWDGYIPGVEVCAVQLPGRQERFRERAFTRLADLVDAARQALLPELRRPFALFGHSLGALVAFELARALRNAHGLSPVRLFVSGRRAPPRPEPNPPLHQLPDATLIDQVRRLWNGIPAALQREPAVLEMLLPTLRADLAVGETYAYRDEAPLACPISCFGGRDDGTLTPSDLAEWREQTAAGFRLQMFPGDHFFLKSAQDALLRAVAWDLTTDRQATPSPPLDRSPA